MNEDGPQHLGDVLSAWMDQRGRRKHIDAARAVEAWSEVAGPQVTKATTGVHMESGTRLVVTVRSATWRHALHVKREAWRDRLNEHLGGEVVQEITFR